MMIDSLPKSLPLEMAHIPAMEMDATEFAKFALPDSARLSGDLAKGASPWLDCCIAWLKIWSPRAFEGFYESTAIWVLSTIAARRVVLRAGKNFYPSLYIALVAISSLFVKSVTVENAKKLIRKVGLAFLLAADDSTPRRFVADLAGRVPENYGELSESEQAEIENRIAFSAQRGWYCDEFGSFLESMGNVNGIMNEFRGLLRSFDNQPDEYCSNSFSRGELKIRDPYLALLASLTPADLRPLAARGSRLWGDGFFARFAFVAPARNEPPKFGRFPDRELEFPNELTEPLTAWHKRLGMPQVEIEEIEDDEEKGTGRFRVDRLSDLQPKSCMLGSGVWDAFYAYHDSLVRLVFANHIDDLAPNYSRFSEKALRIAMLLASLENNNKIEIRHWARAQGITERWRENLHCLFHLMADATENEATDKEHRVLSIVDRLQPRQGFITPADVGRYLKKVSVIEIAGILDGLFNAGVLEKEKTTRASFKYGRPKPIVEE